MYVAGRVVPQYSNTDTQWLPFCMRRNTPKASWL